MATNKERSDYAEAALTTFGDLCGYPLKPGYADDLVSDLISDLGHYCDQHGLDFKERVTNAFAHWSTERRSSDGEPVCNNDDVKVTITEHA